MNGGWGKSLLNVLKIALPLAALAVYPLVISDRLLLHVVVLIGIYFLLALGMSLLFGYAGQFSFSQAAFFGIGAYCSAILTFKYHQPIWLGFFAGAIIPGLAAYAIGRPILRLTGYYLAMGTLAFGQISFVLFNELAEYTGGPSGRAGLPPVVIGTLTLDTPNTYYYLVWAAAVFLFWFSRNVINSRIGRALRAISGSEMAAKAMGIDTADYKTKIFAIAAVYSGIAGSLFAHYLLLVTPEVFSVGTSILVVVMVAIGGVHSLWGAAIGAAFITLLPEMLRGFAQYHRLLFGLVLILVMMFAPGGILGLLSTARQMISTRRAALTAKGIARERAAGEP